jgi:hypothetical protein
MDHQRRTLATAAGATRLGLGDVAVGLRERAEKLKAAFAGDFWLEEEQRCRGNERAGRRRLRIRRFHYPRRLRFCSAKCSF